MTVLLLDAYNLLFRSFASLPEAITDRSGAPINAIYGLVAACLRLAREVEPDAMVAAFDVPEVPTFRHVLYSDYQGHRGPLGGDRAADFARQAAMARQGLGGIGIPALALPGYEADDIMGTTAVRVAEAGGNAIIVSTDRDLLQLVQPGIGVLPPGGKAGVIADGAAVEDRMGVPPSGITTLKALAGDPSDNIPGVTGIGEKSARMLVQEFGDLESVYAHIQQIPSRLSGKLEAGRERAFLFQKVVTIVVDLNLPVEAERLPRPGLSADTDVRTALKMMGIDRE